MKDFITDALHAKAAAWEAQQEAAEEQDSKTVPVIQPDRQYLLRDGTVVGPLIDNHRNHQKGMLVHLTWRWSWFSPTEGWLSWTQDGRWSTLKPGPRDIWMEWPEVASKEYLISEDMPEEISQFGNVKLSSTPAPMTKAKLLDLAREAVTDRGLNYGKPEDNFARIATLWNSHLANRGIVDIKVNGSVLTPGDVAMMCALLKLARLQNDSKHRDSWVDLAGYAACGAEIELGGVSR